MIIFFVFSIGLLISAFNLFLEKVNEIYKNFRNIHRQQGIGEYAESLYQQKHWFNKDQRNLIEAIVRDMRCNEYNQADAQLIRDVFLPKIVEEDAP